jgi:predicted ATP-dependent endonuclease of OLD family
MPVAAVINLSTVFGTDDETRRFVRRYLRATHCDLFFADAAILVEGTAERMLVPHFIAHQRHRLHCCYITLLEVNGSHAHRLRPLIEALGLLSLIVADLDLPPRFIPPSVLV